MKIRKQLEKNEIKTSAVEKNFLECLEPV